MSELFADFNKAFKRVLSVEKRIWEWNEKEDFETYCGIYKKYNKKDEIWNVVDKSKKDVYKANGYSYDNSTLGKERLDDYFRYSKENKKLLNIQLEKDSVYSLVAPIYKIKYWDKIEAGHLHDQLVAENLFDVFVNPGDDGYIQAIKFIFESRGIDFKTLGINSISLSNVPEINNAINSLVSSGGEKGVILSIEVSRFKYYLNLVIANPKKYALNIKGWFDRTLSMAVRGGGKPLSFLEFLAYIQGTKYKLDLRGFYQVLSRFSKVVVDTLTCRSSA